MKKYRYKVKCIYYWQVDGEQDGPEQDSTLFHFSDREDLTVEEIVYNIEHAAFDAEETAFVKIKGIHEITMEEIE